MWGQQKETLGEVVILRLDVDLDTYIQTSYLFDPFRVVLKMYDYKHAIPLGWILYIVRPRRGRM